LRRIHLSFGDGILWYVLASFVSMRPQTYTMTILGLLVLLSLPKAIHLLKSFMKKIPEAADAITAQLNTIFGLLLIVALILNRVVHL